MPVLHPVELKMKSAWPPESWQDVTVLLAVSGGADSVALLRSMHSLTESCEVGFYVAHFNHALRGAESDADEAFVVDLCRQLGVPCETGRAGTGRAATNRGNGLEAAARSARYEFLTETAARLGARYVVTAHTADDQAETILFRILRGTGIGGLGGMTRARALGPAATLIRPLLQVRRAELVGYLDDLGQAYRRDSSNDDLHLTRNRIRHELLPEVTRRFNPEVVDALLRLGALAGEAQAVVDGAAGDLAQRSVSVHGVDEVLLDATALAGQSRYLIRELLMAVWRQQDWPLQAMGFAQWDLLEAMLRQCAETHAERPPRRMFPGGVLVEPGEGRLRLVRKGH